MLFSLYKRMLPLIIAFRTWVAPNEVVVCFVDVLTGPEVSPMHSQGMTWSRPVQRLFCGELTS